MTANQDLDRQLAGWFQDRSTATLPEGLLARSLARVDSTGQRPGWRLGAFPAAPLAGRRSAVPTWAVLLLALVAAAAVVAAGARLFELPRPAVITGPTTHPAATTAASVPAPATPEITPSGPLGGRVILAEAFTSRDVEGPHDLVAIDGATGVRTLLASLPGGVNGIFTGAHPITFSRSASDSRVLILDPDGARQVDNVTAEGARYGFLTGAQASGSTEFSPDWLRLSPAGDRIAFVNHDRFDNPIDIVVRNLDSGSTTQLPLPPGLHWFFLLGWSPDETMLLASGCGPCNLAASPDVKQTPHHAHLYVIPLDGSPVRELLDLENAALIGAWLPDSAQVMTQAFFCPAGSFMPRCDTATGEWSLGVLRVRDAVNTEFANGQNGLFESAVSPDGQRVAYRTNDGLVVQRLDGGPPLELASGEAFYAGWSPDGEWILFERSTQPSTTPTELWIVPSSGGDARLVGTGLVAATW